MLSPVSHSAVGNAEEDCAIVSPASECTGVSIYLYFSLNMSVCRCSHLSCENCGHSRDIVSQNGETEQVKTAKTKVYTFTA